MKIDIVIPWVDGSDPKWVKQYNEYKSIGGDNRSVRFQDLGTLKYVFRGIDTYCPWVNKVFFITCGQKPDWLNENCDKLVLIDHKDYIPEKYLPTFSSHTIELNLHRLEGLSEHFVYFNDDMLILNPVKQSCFFDNNNYPVLPGIMDSHVSRTYPPFYMPINNAALVNRNFEKHSVLLKHPGKFYSTKYGKLLIKNIQFSLGKGFYGFKMYHLPSPNRKSTIASIWNQEFDILNDVCTHKFRNHTDVNQWIFQAWEICNGTFSPIGFDTLGDYCLLDGKKDIERAVKIIDSSTKAMTCINDGPDLKLSDFAPVTEALNRKFPDKSQFEL